jgi:hypothetical protein
MYVHINLHGFTYDKTVTLTCEYIPHNLKSSAYFECDISERSLSGTLTFLQEM